MEPRRTVFFKEAIKTLKTSGSFVPSSKRLAKRMLKDIDFNKAQVIVEFGPGTGVITRQILNNLNPNAILIAIETNPVFYKQLSKIKNHQFKCIQTSAENIQSVLEKEHFSKVCAVVSSLPLANIPNKIVVNILKNAKNALQNGGQYVQFQYSLQQLKMLKLVFKKVKIDFELVNFPPAFVYRCE